MINQNDNCDDWIELMSFYTNFNPDEIQQIIWTRLIELFLTLEIGQKKIHGCLLHNIIDTYESEYAHMSKHFIREFPMFIIQN